MSELVAALVAMIDVESGKFVINKKSQKKSENCGLVMSRLFS